MDISDFNSITVQGTFAQYTFDEKKLGEDLSKLNSNLVLFLKGKGFHCLTPINLFQNSLSLEFQTNQILEDSLKRSFTFSESINNFLGNFFPYFKNKAINSACERRLNNLINPSPFFVSINIRYTQVKGRDAFFVIIEIQPALIIKLQRCAPVWRANLLHAEDINLVRKASINLFHEISSSVHADIIDEPGLIKKDVEEIKIQLPPELQISLKKFREDRFPSQKTAFIIMRFAKTDAHDQIAKTIKNVLSNKGLLGLRADDKEYSSDKLTNILTYVHGCDFAIAIFDNIDTDYFNPNVSLEVGSILALNKPVCLLKDKPLETIPPDIVGRLYREFDSKNCEETIASELKKWLMDYNYIQIK